MKKALLLFICLGITIGFFACKNSTEKSEKTNTSQVDEAMPIELDSNFVMENIIALKTFDAISAKFGPENIKKDSLIGSKNHCTVLYPGTANQVILYWDQKEKYNQILSAVINCDSAGYKGKWCSKLGLQPGQKMDQIIALNKKEFTISGFEWDYAGHVVSWEGGQLDFKKITGRFSDFGKSDISAEEKLSIKGDTEFNVSLPAIKKMNPILCELVVAAK